MLGNWMSQQLITVRQSCSHNSKNCKYNVYLKMQHPPFASTLQLSMNFCWIGVQEAHSKFNWCCVFWWMHTTSMKLGELLALNSSKIHAQLNCWGKRWVLHFQRYTVLTVDVWTAPAKCVFAYVLIECYWLYIHKCPLSHVTFQHCLSRSREGLHFSCFTHISHWV